MIGIATDGENKMTGCNVGVATQFERQRKPGFFRIWCTAHQVDLVVKKQIKQMFNNIFVHMKSFMVFFFTLHGARYS
jgi:hypothetical protein